MSMAPHWLDEVFDDARRTETDFFRHSRAKAAFAAAIHAYRQAEESRKKFPTATGNDPSQAARVAFLDEINRA